MTREEYMHLTAYTSVDQAGHDLRTVRLLLAAIFFVALISQYLVSFVSDFDKNLAILVMLGIFAFFVYVLLFCQNIIKKTRHVSLARLGYAAMYLLGFAALPFALILMPICYLWFVMPLTSPLEIISGEKQPPENIRNIEQERIKMEKADAAALRTILIISLILAVVLGFLSYMEIRGQGIRF